MKFVVTFHCPRGVGMNCQFAGSRGSIYTALVEAEHYVEALEKASPGVMDVDKVEITKVTRTIEGE